MLTEVNKHVETARNDSSGTQQEGGTYELGRMIQGRLTTPSDTEGGLHLARGSGTTEFRAQKESGNERERKGGNELNKLHADKVNKIKNK